MRSVELQENVEVVLAAEFSIHRGIDAIRDHYASWVDAYPYSTLEPTRPCDQIETAGSPGGRYLSKAEALRAAALSECAEPRS